MILAGDIGGTNSRLAFFCERSGRLEFVVEATYPSQDHANLETIAGEGGHASFAPIDPVQIELLNFLRHEFGEVSWERVVSGPGLHNIYRFLRDTGRGEEPDWLARQMRQPDPSAVISQRHSPAPVPSAGRPSICSWRCIVPRPAIWR